MLRVYFSSIYRYVGVRLGGTGNKLVTQISMTYMNLKPTKLLSERWRSSGIEPGMLLLVHSNILRTMQEFQKEDIPLTVNDILDSFIEAVGPEGTLLFPLFNFDFSWGKSFDMRTSKSSMGALTEAARLRTDSVRTGHPVYSFAVLGRLKEKFRGLNNLTAYGAGSPFEMVHSMRVYVAVLDLTDQASMTFYHHVEEMEKKKEGIIFQMSINSLPL